MTDAAGAPKDRPWWWSSDQRLHELLADFMAVRYPEGCAGEAIDGVELVLLGADIFGIATHYRRNAKRLSVEHRELLGELLDDFHQIRAKLPSEEARTFYGKVAAIGEYLLETR
jgi:hypothetical protein